MVLYFQLADVQFLTHFNTSDVDIDDKETIEVHGFLIKNCIGTLRVQLLIIPFSSASVRRSHKFDYNKSDS